MDAKHLQECAVSETQSCIFLKSLIFHDTYLWEGLRRDLINQRREQFFYVPESMYTNFNQKISMYSFGKDFFSFLCKILQNLSSRLSEGMNFHFIWFFAYSRNSAYFPHPITLELSKSPDSNYLKLTIKESTVLCPPLYLNCASIISVSIKVTS